MGCISSRVEEGSSARSDTGVDFSTLPEACIVYILALTSPPDVCRMRAVAPWLLPVVESDALWLRFLPEDYLQILARSSESTSSSLRDFSSKKELFFHLCESPLLIDEGKKMFWLEKRSGKKCYMSAAKELTIIGADTPQHWTWYPVPESRFSEIACLNDVSWLQIKGTINVSMLSLGTNYAAYLVFNLKENSSGFDDSTVKSSIKIEGVETTIRLNYLTKGKVMRMDMYMHLIRRHRDEGDRTWLARWALHMEELRRRELHPSQEHLLYPTKRKDGWLEVELGEFFTKGGEDIEVEITHLDQNLKSGLMVEGIEIRPKDKGERESWFWSRYPNILKYYDS